MTNAPPIFTIAVGSQRTLVFQLRIRGTRNYWDVSGASSIVMEWQSQAGTPQTPLVANADDPAADWSIGLVAVDCGPDDVFSEVQTVEFTLVTVISGQTIAEPIGAIEVVPRPGYPEP